MTMDHNNRPTAALDPYLSKESLSVLATMGFGKKEPWHGPHKHHGIAARTRLSIAGNVRAGILYLEKSMENTNIDYCIH